MATENLEDDCLEALDEGIVQCMMYGDTERPVERFASIGCPIVPIKPNSDTE